ncbi:response regulator [Paenibacillus sp. GP183]|uniref:response regulator n=1 Tax=Paenibacillus sp. GP183 TaxID=1882751 RepID=UPI0008955D4A|nr:response regulator [Paenibacillus sp. GP183]SEC47467.1 two-component system, response regulator YesN [Paenibacillus sp. GP183]
MYKLMLVDDEEDVREGVFQEIDWEACGFEVIEKAENGQEALELMEKQIPDIVVTDIQMPFMNGLEMSELIREKYPMTKIIILTGHDEFEYAQKAVKLHIDEYVLKPFSSQELMHAILKVKDRMDAETAEKENMHILREHYRDSLPVMREAFLASLLTRKLSLKEITEKSEHFSIKLDGNGYAVSVISMDHMSENNNETSFKTSVDQELKLFAVFNIAEEIAQRHGAGIVFMHFDQVILLSVSEEREGYLPMARTLAVLEEIRQSIEKFLKFSVTIGVSSVTSAITDCLYAYKDAISALDYRFIHGNNRIICIDDVEKRVAEKLRFDEDKEHALIRCLKVGSVTEVKELVEDLFQGIADTPVSYQDYQVYLLEILISLLKAAKQSDIDMDHLFGADFTVFTEINKFNNIQEAKSWIVGICAKIMDVITRDRQYTYKNLVDMAKEYTQQHYHESDISINKLCNHLHISAGYFSSIFKKETKMTFVNYLMQIRMDAAKELLRSTDLKAFEVAEKVGYSDPNYFSFSFRKQVGISPKEYRNTPRGG